MGSIAMAANRKRWYEKSFRLPLNGKEYTLVPLRDDQLASHGVFVPVSTLRSWRNRGKLPEWVIVKVSRYPFLVLEKWKEFIRREYQDLERQAA